MTWETTERSGLCVFGSIVWVCNRNPARMELYVYKLRGSAPRVLMFGCTSLLQPGPRVYINDLLGECKDGLLLLRVLDSIEPGCVDWSKVANPPRNRFQALGNCNQVCNRGSIYGSMGFTVIVGVFFRLFRYRGEISSFPSWVRLITSFLSITVSDRKHLVYQESEGRILRMATES